MRSLAHGLPCHNLDVFFALIAAVALFRKNALDQSFKHIWVSRSKVVEYPLARRIGIARRANGLYVLVSEPTEIILVLLNKGILELLQERWELHNAKISTKRLVFVLILVLRAGPLFGAVVCGFRIIRVLLAGTLLLLGCCWRRVVVVVVFEGGWVCDL